MRKNELKNGFKLFFFTIYDKFNVLLFLLFSSQKKIIFLIIHLFLRTPLIVFLKKNKKKEIF